MAFVGGTGGVFRHYETDYWLTCYKEAVERFNSDSSRARRGSSCTASRRWQRRSPRPM